MDPRTGKKIRLGRLIDGRHGRTVIIAASHGLLSGPPIGLRTLADQHRVFTDLGLADGIMVAPGSVSRLEDCFIGTDRPALVIHIDWKSHGRPLFTPGSSDFSEGTTGQVVSVEDAAHAGADAVMTYLYVGQRDNDLERREIEKNARVAAECDRQGIPLIIEPRWVHDHLADRRPDPRMFGWYARLSAELGADMVKCVWPGSVEAMAEVVDVTPVPVVLAGGAGSDAQIAETMELADAAVRSGAAGVMFGRRVYGSSRPGVVLAGLRHIVHEGGSASEAVSMFAGHDDQAPSS